MPFHLMHHSHNHLHICIITGSQEESVAAEPEAARGSPAGRARTGGAGRGGRR
jgi:hypothetical protein